MAACAKKDWQKSKFLGNPFLNTGHTDWTDLHG